MYKLVIIDDEEYTIEGIKQIIDWKSLGIDVIGSANSGESGVKLILEQNPDIVIVDVIMGKMTGLEMLKICRESGYSGAAIVLSAYNEFEYAKQAIECRVMKYMVKPVDETELEEVIVGIIEELEHKNPFTQVIATKGGSAQKIMENVLRYIDGNFTKNIQLESIAESCYCSVAYLSRIFKEHTGISYSDYIMKKRIEMAKKLLKQKNISINDAMRAVGYKDAKHFRKIFMMETGVLPSTYKDKIMKGSNINEEK